MKRPQRTSLFRARDVTLILGCGVLGAVGWGLLANGLLGQLAVPYVCLWVIADVLWLRRQSPADRLVPAAVFIPALLFYQVGFIGGMDASLHGRAELRGYPVDLQAEAANLDRRVRLERVGPSDHPVGPEAAYLADAGHNAAVYLALPLFGPPTQTYRGAYPTEQEAVGLLETGGDVGVEAFADGIFEVPGGSYWIDEELAGWILRTPAASDLRQLRDGRGLAGKGALDEIDRQPWPIDAASLGVRANDCGESCLVVSTHYDFQSPDEPSAGRVIYLVDTERSVVFAQYVIE